jgi:chromate reductase, NAD(P)H dehydrogenase (quinone)
MIDILVVSGSNRSGRQSVKAAEHIVDFLNTQDNVRAKILDLAKYSLPAFDDNDQRSTDVQTDINTIRSAFQACQGMVVVSPEYNGGMAGSLKNTLDYFRPEYSWKPFGAVSVSSGTLGGQNAMQQLVQFASYVNACLMPSRLLVSQVNEIGSGSDADKRFTKDAQKFCLDMIKFTKLLSAPVLK